MIILTLLSYVFIKLETFVNSTLLISEIIIRSSHIPSHIKGSSWFSHADSLKNYPGSMLLLSIYSIITGLTPQQVINLPILLPIAVIFVYILSKVASSSKLSFLLSYFGFVAFYLINTINLYTISYHSLGYVYYLMYLHLILLLYIRKNANVQSLMLLVIISTVSTITYYFTSTLIMTTSLSIICIYALYALLHRVARQDAVKTLNLALFLSIIIVMIGELVYTRIISGMKLDLARLKDLYSGLMHIGGTQVKEFEKVIFISDLAKAIYTNARVILLDRLSTIYVYYINGLVVLLSIVRVLCTFSKLCRWLKRPNPFLLLYVAIFIGSVVHALYYFVTYGALGTRAYMFFVLPFSPIAFTYLINEITVFSKYSRASINKLLICFFTFFLVSSFIGGVYSDVVAGFIGGYTRSSNMEAIKTLPEAISLSSILDPTIVVLTDYPRSQYVFRGFILHNKVGEVRLYLGRLRILVNMSYLAIPLELKSVYNAMGADALLIAVDNFNKLVYGDIAAYIAPPLNYTIIEKLVQHSNKIYSGTRLMLLAKPHG